MPSRRRPYIPPLVGSTGRLPAAGTNGGRFFSPVDFHALAKRIERPHRQALPPRNGSPFASLPADYFVRATWVSFLLDDIELSQQDVQAALAQGPERRPFRSRQVQRLRNHAAILHHVENYLRRQQPITPAIVVRWYTSISAGLSTAPLDGPTTARLDELIRRLATPPARLSSALEDVTVTYARLLVDPLLPAFNGIVARLLLRYHMGRCGLPAILFDPNRDRRPTSLQDLARQVTNLIQESYEQIGARE